MSGHIYIIKDGDKTKIGISISLDKRLSSYKTHTPNHQLFKTYPCPIDEAKRIELVIKQVFKDKLAGQGKEWFSIPAEEIDRFVCFLLDASPTISDAMPSLHGIKLTDEANALLNGIYDAVHSKGEINSQPLKEQFAELFSKAFQLGIPYHKLPDDLLQREYLYVDLNHADKHSRLVREAVTGVPRMPHDNHCFYFFHILKLSSGHGLATCTAKISMPYMEALKGNTEKEVFDHAKELGLWATFHHDWSWWYPTKTALILYQPKTPVSQIARQWDKSFRKWVMERKEVLKFEDHEDRYALERCIDDVCDDKNFPLEFKNYSDLHGKYLGPFHHFQDEKKMDDEDYADDRSLAMRYLVGVWKSGSGSEAAQRVVGMK
jgi:hypothetical protein